MLIIGDYSPCIAARIGGVVICAVIIHRPIHELKMAVGSNRVRVKKIGKAQFARVDFEPLVGLLRRQ